MRQSNDVKRLSVSAPLADCRGQACPLPIIALARVLRDAPEAELWADDPAARADLDAFCAATGHELVAADAAGGLLRAVVRRR